MVIQFEVDTEQSTGGVFTAEKTASGQWLVKLLDYGTATLRGVLITTTSDSPWVVIHDALTTLDQQGRLPT